MNDTEHNYMCMDWVAEQTPLSANNNDKESDQEFMIWFLARLGMPGYMRHQSGKRLPTINAKIIVKSPGLSKIICNIPEYYSAIELLTIQIKSVLSVLENDDITEAERILHMMQKTLDRNRLDNILEGELPQE